MIVTLKPLHKNEKKKKKSKVLEQFRKDSLKTKTVSLLINLEIRNVQCNKMALCDFFFFLEIEENHKI